MALTQAAADFVAKRTKDLLTGLQSSHGVSEATANELAGLNPALRNALKKGALNAADAHKLVDVEKGELIQAIEKGSLKISEAGSSSTESAAELYRRLREEGVKPEKIFKKVTKAGGEEGVESVLNATDRMIIQSLERGAPLIKAEKIAKNVTNLTKTGGRIVKTEIPLSLAFGAFEYATAKDDRERVEARTGTELAIGGCAAGVATVGVVNGFIVGLSGGTGLPLAGAISAIACGVGAWKATDYKESLANTVMGSTRLADEINDYNFVVSTAESQRAVNKLDNNTIAALNAEKEILGKMVADAGRKHQIQPDTQAQIEKNIAAGVKISTREKIR